MKVDRLMDAIEEIDDRYIEESAYGVRRKSRIPWGMIITAACFCMVIGATMFMQSLGILPHLNGTTATTSQPVTTVPSDTTEPSNTTKPPETTDAVDDSAVMEEIKALFSDKSSWYYRALVDEFDSPKNLRLRYYFYNSTEFGEGLQPTKEEMEELMALMPDGGTPTPGILPDGGTPTLVILPVSKMDAVLTEVFDITVAEMDTSAFAGMKYAESIDSWCFWGTGTLNENSGSIQHVEKVAGDIYRVVYEIPYAVSELSFNPRYESHEIRVKVYGDSCHILSNILIEIDERPTEPPETRPSVEEFFSDRENWQNHLILPMFSDPTEIDLRPDYLRAMDGESTYATDLEHEKLSTGVRGYSRDKLFRATKAQLDEVMLALFNITTDQLTTDWESHFTYLAETDCYYGRANNAMGYTVYIGRTEECDDGTILMYYALANGEEPYMVAKLQPHDTGYYILSNEPYVDNTGKSEDQIAMEELFKGSSWYNRALACEYNSPKEMNLRKFFYGGFKGEPQDPTDQEREQLENLGINLNYDLMRLPVDKMNEVLTEYFGITLADMEPEAFSGLVYLESTNCYYHSTSGWLGVENFEALSVERMDDGRILVRYPYMKYEYVVTLKPHGDSYQVLSNVLAEPFRPYGVDAAELNALLQEVANGNLTEDRRNEIRLPLLGTFLEDPDLFVSSLVEQQKSQAGVLGIFAPTVNYLHPSYAAYNQTIREMLPKVQSEEEKRVIYWMAFYSGLGNFLPQTPGAQDYALLFDMMLYSDGAFAEGCAYRMEQYCKGDPTAYAAAMGLTKEEHWDLYAFQTVAFMKQEDRALVKQSMTEVIEDIKHLEGYDIKAVTACAELIIKYCDNPIK